MEAFLSRVLPRLALSGLPISRANLEIIAFDPFGSVKKRRHLHLSRNNSRLRRAVCLRKFRLAVSLRFQLPMFATMKRLLLILVTASFALPFDGQAETSYTFGMVAKSQGNPFFEAARVGANDAARALGAKHS